MLVDGVLSVSEIARIHNVSRVRVRQIRNRLVTTSPLVEGGTSTPTQEIPATQLQSLGMKTLNLHLTPAVFAALTEACQLTNHNSDEPITVTDYVEECLITRLSELGLIRRKRK